MRSLLFVPGDSEKKLEKGFRVRRRRGDRRSRGFGRAGTTSRRRAPIASAFIGRATARASATKIYVRVNDLVDRSHRRRPRRRGRRRGRTASCCPNAMAAPMSQQLSAMLRVHEAENGLPDGRIRIIADDHRDRGWRASRRRAIATPSARLAGVTWGAEDLSAAIGASRHARRERPLHRRLPACPRGDDPRRPRSPMSPRSTRCSSISATPTGCGAECLEAERDGFTAKLAIHPAQVPVINEAFTPSPDAVAHSQAIVQAFADAGNPGVVGIDGQMYDRPHLRRAERLLARAAAAGIA